jgi:hypothetical protein
VLVFERLVAVGTSLSGLPPLRICWLFYNDTIKMLSPTIKMFQDTFTLLLRGRLALCSIIIVTTVKKIKLRKHFLPEEMKGFPMLGVWFISIFFMTSEESARCINPQPGGSGNFWSRFSSSYHLINQYQTAGQQC